MDYEFYRNTYGGKLSEQIFNSFLARAKAILGSLTFFREVPEDMEERYNLTLCELLDIEYENSSNTSSIKSETIDDYSVTYDSSAKSTNYLAVAKKYGLDRPTNLIYVGVEAND